MGSAAGAIKVAAARTGVTEAEYRQRVAAGWKWCTACKGWQKRTRFVKDSSRGDGLRSRCKAHDARLSPGPGKPERGAWAAAGLSWCRHCTQWLPLTEVRSGLCRDGRNAEYRKNYREGTWRISKAQNARRRGIQALGPNTHEAIFESTGGLCAYGCGRQANTIDHVVPVARGGQTEPGNVVPACVTCNSSKRDRDPLPWIERMTADGFQIISPGLAYDGPVMELVCGG